MNICSSSDFHKTDWTSPPQRNIPSLSLSSRCPLSPSFGKNSLDFSDRGGIPPPCKARHLREHLWNGNWWIKSLHFNSFWDKINMGNKWNHKQGVNLWYCKHDIWHWNTGPLSALNLSEVLWQGDFGTRLEIYHGEFVGAVLCLIPSTQPNSPRGRQPQLQQQRN